YNDLLGAFAPNGEDWCYYSFPNGKRVHTTYWRCCKSSGAMALEELSAVAYARNGNDLCVNLLGPGHATLALESAGRVRLEQITNYPFDGRVKLRIHPERAASFGVRIRIPSWADRVDATINGASIPGVSAGEFLTLNREWHAGDELTLNLPMQPRIHRRASQSVQESRAPDGEPITQEVMHYDYLALTYGPLVFATTLIDGYKIAETLLMSGESLDQAVEVVSPQSGPELRLRSQGREPLTFTPYFATGGRQDGAWRLTWMQVSWT
ncbi:MAG TPA: hypothetical protein VIU34_33400, partial [Steroidobacter sp.]